MRQARNTSSSSTYSNSWYRPSLVHNKAHSLQRSTTQYKTLMYQPCEIARSSWQISLHTRPIQESSIRSIAMLSVTWGLGFPTSVKRPTKLLLLSNTYNVLERCSKKLGLYGKNQRATRNRHGIPSLLRQTGSHTGVVCCTSTCFLIQRCH